MSASEGSPKGTSRRRFIRWTGAFAGLIFVSAVIGAGANRFLGQRATPATDVSTQTMTVSPAATTVTTTETSESTVAVDITQELVQTTTMTKTATLTKTTGRTVTETVTVGPLGSATAVPAGSQPPFSIFWITDTQFLSETNPALFGEMTNWIVNQWGPYNGKLVIHTGDIVQTGAHQVEWQNADNAMSVFLQNGIPYSWCAGNHDDLIGSDSSSGWIGNQYAATFDPIFVSPQVNTMQGASWVGDYHNGMNTALTFSANGLDYLVVNLEWNGQADVLKWAGGILDDPKYRNHRVILAAHAYINALGFALEYGLKLDLSTFVNGFTSLLESHPNVFLTLNGHYATECGYNTPSPVNGRNELMFDRQDCTDDPKNPIARGIDITTNIPDNIRVGGSTVTILTCDPANNKVGVRTFDVNTYQWRTDEYEQYSFTMFPTLYGTTSSSTATA